MYRPVNLLVYQIDFLSTNQSVSLSNFLSVSLPIGQLSVNQCICLIESVFFCENYIKLIMYSTVEVQQYVLNKFRCNVCLESIYKNSKSNVSIFAFSSAVAGLESSVISFYIPPIK